MIPCPLSPSNHRRRHPSFTIIYFDCCCSSRASSEQQGRLPSCPRPQTVTMDMINVLEGHGNGTFCFFLKKIGALPFAGTRFLFRFSGVSRYLSTGVSSNQSKIKSSIKAEANYSFASPIVSPPSLSSLSLPFHSFPEPVCQSANTSAVTVVSRTRWQ
jgi:hypothetical protein